jgi:preprotein translocase subunit SecG
MEIAIAVAVILVLLLVLGVVVQRKRRAGGVIAADTRSTGRNRGGKRR